MGSHHDVKGSRHDIKGSHHNIMGIGQSSWHQGQSSWAVIMTSRAVIMGIVFMAPTLAWRSWPYCLPSWKDSRNTSRKLAPSPPRPGQIESTQESPAATNRVNTAEFCSHISTCSFLMPDWLRNLLTFLILVEFRNSRLFLSSRSKSVSGFWMQEGKECKTLICFNQSKIE